MDEDGIYLATGRRFYANHRIVGINEDLDVYEGYDGGVFDWPTEGTYETAGWPDADLHALADMMLARWAAFKEKIGQQQVGDPVADYLNSRKWNDRA